jgi:hypothetical protein
LIAEDIMILFEKKRKLETEGENKKRNRERQPRKT